MRLVSRVIRGVLSLAVIAAALSALTGVAAAQRLEVWLMTTFVPAQNNWLRSQILSWAAERDVKVNLSVLSRPLYGERIITAIQSGKLPDVVIQGEPGVALAAERGLLVPLDDVVDRLGRDDIYPAALELNRYQGRIYGIPLFFEINPLHVREDLLAAKGLALPQTLDDLWKAARAVNNPPSLYALAFTLGPSPDGDRVLRWLYHAYGGRGYIASKTGDAARYVDTEPMWKALQTLQQLYREGLIPPDAVTWTDLGNNLAYIEGRVAVSSPNAASIYVGLLQNNPALAGKTKLVFVGPVTNDGAESAFVFRSTADKERLGKELIYYLFQDKEAYRVNMVEATYLYALPIFRSQAEVIRRQWTEGRWPMYPQNPVEILEKSQIVNMWPTAYPLGEMSSVIEKVYVGGKLMELAAPVFLQSADPRVTAGRMAEYINSLVKETYR